MNRGALTRDACVKRKHIWDFLAILHRHPAGFSIELRQSRTYRIQRFLRELCHGEPGEKHDDSD